MNETTAGCRARAGSPIEFRLDMASAVPGCRQLVRQAGDVLRLSCHGPGGQQPEVRGMVTVLAISPDTVLKADKALGTSGLAIAWPGQGTFIRAALSHVAVLGSSGCGGLCPANWSLQTTDLARAA
jgi:hypothetical protein